MKSLHTSVRLLLCALLVALLGGCTQNNGHIGDIFGTWRLTELTCDGVPQDIYPAEGEPGYIPQLYTFSFQGSIVVLFTIYEHNSYLETFGTWQRDGKTLFLDFGHSDNDGTETYTPPAELYLYHDVAAMNIEKLTSSEMHFWRILDDGVRIDYYLNKAY